MLALCLLVSLSANIYLMATRTGERRQAHSGSRPYLTTKAQDTSPPEPRTTVPPAIPRDIKGLDRSALEKRVAETEAGVAQLLPLPERFTLAERTPENEERIRPFLDRIFGATKDEAPQYDVECHGNVCQLMTDVSPSEWQEELQSDPHGAGNFRAMEFGGRGTFMELEEPGHAAGSIQAGVLLIDKITMTLDKSPRVAECKKENPTPGHVELIVVFEPTARRLMVLAGGSLQWQPGGLCIRRVLEEIVANTPVPPDVTALPRSVITVRVP
jgi:hypothetical protein